MGSEKKPRRKYDIMLIQTGTKILYVFLADDHRGMYDWHRLLHIGNKMKTTLLQCMKKFNRVQLFLARKNFPCN